MPLKAFLVAVALTGPAAALAEEWTAGEVANGATEALTKEGISLEKQGLAIALLPLERGRWSVVLEEPASPKAYRARLLERLSQSREAAIAEVATVVLWLLGKAPPAAQSPASPLSAEDARAVRLAALANERMSSVFKNGTPQAARR